MAMDEYTLERNFRQAVNIGESPWSVTSAGPSNPVLKSPIASSPPSSIHLDRRASGTASLTPIAVTSWGPTDDEWFSNVSSVSRLASPDMGECMIEDIPAPRLRAVWGNSFGWRSAKTWNEVYPYSASQTKSMVRVQLQHSNSLVLQYPNLVIYPTVGSHPDTHSSPNIFARPKSSTRPVWGSSFGWQRAVTWKKIYPYSIATVESVAPIQLRGAGGLVSKYPNLCIYPVIYPYLEICPACTVGEDTSRVVSVVPNESNNVTMRYPTLVIYPTVYPHFDIYPPTAKDVVMNVSSLPNTRIHLPNGVSTLYPTFVIYPVVYPHFDLYPKALQISEPLKQKVIDVELVNVGCLTAEYPNTTTYPNAYPYLDIHPAQETNVRTSSAVWGVSFGRQTAKTWLQAYPLHNATPLTTRRAVDDPKIYSTGSRGRNPTTVGIVIGKQAIWGRSFGWKSATTWRAVWPTTCARIHSNVSPISDHLGQQSDLSSNYPHLTIYPVAYPKFDIYPPRATIVEVEGSRATKNNQCIINLIPHYPNLVIYPPVYPHIDVYPPFTPALVSITRGNGQSNLRRRHIEMWKAKTAAQVALDELPANNHNWEAYEPLQIDLTWSRTSAGPSTSPAELTLTPPIQGSVHIDRRIQWSVLLTPSTATTWGPQDCDDDRYSDMISIERLPSPDLGQRVFGGVVNIEFHDQPWHLVWPFFGNASRVKKFPSALEKPVSVPEYPHLVIYPPADPHFELYPAWANILTSKNQVTETLGANSNRYPVLDIYPAAYPHFNIYPAIDLRVEVPSRTVPNVWHERVEVKLPTLYPDFDIYRVCYPYNLDYIYPPINVIQPTPTPIKGSRRYPWLVVYPPVYPFIIPYPGFLAELSQPLIPQQPPSILSLPRKSVSVKLPVRYPTLDIYSVGYPWSLESIYPAVTADDRSRVVKPPYPCVWTYTAPFEQPHPGPSDPVHIPGALDEDESAKAFLALSEHIRPESVVYPYFNLYPALPALPPRQARAVQDVDLGDFGIPPSQMPPTMPRKDRKTHMELHPSVFRCLEKQPARNSKTHSQLHTEVFQDGTMRTPSGYARDLTSLTAGKREDMVPVESQRRPSRDNVIPRPPHSTSRTLTFQSPDKIVFPHGQPPAVPPISLLRARIPAVPSQPPLAVSETPTPRVSSPTNGFAHKRTTNSRLSQAVKSMMPRMQRPNSSASPVSPLPEEHKEHTKDQQSPTRFQSLVDRWPHTSTSDLPTRAPQSSQRKESLVLQRARAYEQATATNQTSSAVGTKGTRTPSTLPPLPSMRLMTDVVETVENSEITFP